MSTSQDDELVQRARAGDPGAFAAIHHRYAGELEAHARSILGSRHPLVEDVVQEAFMRTYRALDADADRTIVLRPWLHRLVRNAALDELRRKGNHCAELDPRVLVCDAADPWIVLTGRWGIRDVLRGVAELPHRQRAALILHAVHGVGHEQVARTLGVTPGASKALVHRARSAL